MRTVEIAYRYEAQDVPLRPRPADADAALLRLQDGNRSFAELLNSVKDDGGPVRRVVEVDPRDLGLLPDAPGAPSQHPFAAVLGCSDARVPLELIFSEGPNDLFVVRVAGNGLGGDVLGSLKYAVEHLGDSLKLVVVLGHSGCGAVSGAVDIFLSPGDYLPLATSFTARGPRPLLVVVHTSARKLVAAFGPDIVRRGVPPGPHRDLHRHQCSARRLFHPAGDRDRCTECVAGGLRRLFAGNASRVGPKTWRPGRSRSGSGSRSPCCVRRAWRRHREVVAHNGAAYRGA